MRYFPAVRLVYGTHVTKQRVLRKMSAGAHILLGAQVTPTWQSVTVFGSATQVLVALLSIILKQTMQVMPVSVARTIPTDQQVSAIGTLVMQLHCVAGKH